MNAVEELLEELSIKVKEVVGSDILEGAPSAIDGLLSRIDAAEESAVHAMISIKVRRRKFLDKVTPCFLSKASDLFNCTGELSIVEIKDLRLPHFSNMSFASKIRMLPLMDESRSYEQHT
jgi:hypothetical protein